MARVLILSSWVGVGHVGLAAAQPALQRLGHEALGLPSIVLSNHRGEAAWAGQLMSTETLTAMIDAMEANGALETLDAALLGYMPSLEHVAFAVEMTTRLRARRPGLRVVCDPIMGDDPDGLYVPPEVATAIREELAPAVDVLTPNRFELSRLNGAPVGDAAEAAAAASRLIDGAPGRVVHVTSPPLTGGGTGVLTVDANGATLFNTRRRGGVPKGAGDVFSALIAAGLTTGQALGKLDALVAQTGEAEHLALTATDSSWIDGAPITGLALEEDFD